MSYESKQLISQIFQVALNLLSWLCFASFSQVYCAHHVCPSSQIYFAVKGKLVYLSSHRFIYSVTTLCMVFHLLITAVSKSTKCNQGFRLLTSLLAWGEKMSIQDVFMAIWSLGSALPSGCWASKWSLALWPAKYGKCYFRIQHRSTDAAWWVLLIVGWNRKFSKQGSSLPEVPDLQEHQSSLYTAQAFIQV